MFVLDLLPTCQLDMDYALNHKMKLETQPVNHDNGKDSLVKCLTTFY